MRVPALLILFLVAHFAGSEAAASLLTPTQREQSRFRLESLFNSMELLFRNQRSHEQDERRLKRDAEALRVFERIPIGREDLPGLKRELKSSAESAGLKLVELRAVDRSALVPLPNRALFQGHNLNLSDEQIAQRIGVEVVVQGSRAEVERWASAWKDQVLRLILPQLRDGKPRIQAGASSGVWKIRGDTFRFREVQYPRVVTEDPIQAFPSVARRDLKSLERHEPALWSWVGKIRALEPKALPELERRRSYFLDRERMRFFISRAR